MTTIVSIALYFLAAFAFGVFTSMERDEQILMFVWVGIAVTLFACAAALQVIA